MRRAFKFIERAWLLLKVIPWLGILRYHKKEAKVVVTFGFLNHGKFGRELIIRELGYIIYLVENKIPFRISAVNGYIKNSVVLWAPNEYYDVHGFWNYSSRLLSLAESVESQGNRLFPSSSELRMLENKYYMYQEFLRWHVKVPPTFLYVNKLEISYEKLEYPLLWKGAHSSGSKDVISCRSEKELRLVLERCEEWEPIILQKRLNIRRDMRVTFVEGELHSAFWRINDSNEWKVTATSQGSRLEFVESLDPNVVDYLLFVMNVCNLTTAGIDICWENDDVNGDPYILEISPLFSINPKIDLINRSYKYGAFKSKVFIKNSYGALQQKELLQISKKYLNGKIG